MSKVWQFIRRDARHLRSSVIAVVVLAGIVAVPSFYAWFNIAGSWDPYGSTNNIRVAVANEDAGYTGTLMPVNVNLGERVVSQLQGSDSIGYVATSGEEAVEGVRAGRYYAAVVIPQSFSSDLMSTFSASPHRAEVRFYQNEKENAIASIVTDKAASSIQAQVSAGFAEAVSQVGASVLSELGRSLNDGEVRAVAQRLDSAVSGATDALSQTAEGVRGFSALLDSTQGLLGSGAQTAEAALDPTTNASSALSDAAGGLADAGEVVDSAEGSVAGALATAGDALDGVDAAIDDAFNVAKDQTQRLREALVAAKDAVDSQVKLLEKLQGALDEQDGLTKEFEHHFAAGSLDFERVESVRASVTGLGERVGAVLQELRELSDELSQVISDLDDGSADAATAREQLSGLVTNARGALASADKSYQTEVKGALGSLAAQVKEAASRTEQIEDGLAATVASVGQTATSAQGALADAGGSLDDAAEKLDEGADQLRGLHEKLQGALDSADASAVRTVLSAGPEKLARFIAEPVSVSRTAIFPVENNGSAMAPFYTTLAIWIGGVVLAALVRATPSSAALFETDCSQTQAYVARLALFCAVGLAQALLICGGDILYLGVQCAHPWLMLLACCVSSLVYVNVIFSLTASFGDVGKAVAVVLMVVQVAGSGGTFPRQMLPEAFQAIYSWLPFVHSEAALRAAMFGIYDGDFWRELAVLLAYLVPALLLGLVARRPVIRLNEWFERKLEATRLM